MSIFSIYFVQFICLSWIAISWLILSKVAWLWMGSSCGRDFHYPLFYILEEDKAVVKSKFCSNSVTLVHSRFDSAIFYDFLFTLCFILYHLNVLLVFSFVCCDCLSVNVLLFGIRLRRVLSLLFISTFWLLILHLI